MISLISPQHNIQWKYVFLRKVLAQPNPHYFESDDFKASNYKVMMKLKNREPVLALHLEVGL